MRPLQQPGCCLRMWGGSIGARSLLLPSLLLLLALGTCTCAFLLRWVLLQGLGWTHPPKPPDPPDLLDLRGGEGETPALDGGLRTPAVPRRRADTEDAGSASRAPTTLAAPSGLASSTSPWSTLVSSLSPRSTLVSSVSPQSTPGSSFHTTGGGVGVSSGPSPTETTRSSPSSAPLLPGECAPLVYLQDPLLNCGLRYGTALFLSFDTLGVFTIRQD